MLGGLLLSLRQSSAPPTAPGLRAALSLLCVYAHLSPSVKTLRSIRQKEFPDIPDRDSPVGDELGDSGQVAQPL